MAKIAVVTYFPRFVRYIDIIKENFPTDDIIVYLGNDEKSIIPLLSDAENNGCTAIVTGAFTYKLIAEHTNLPIIDVEASLSDVISAWARIKSRGISPKHPVIFLKDDNPILIENDISAKLSLTFGCKISIQEFSTRQDYEFQLRSLPSNVDMVIAGEHSIAVCKELNLPNEFLQIGLNTMNSGILQALRISNNILNEKIKNARLNSILNVSNDGIIYVNKNKEIEIINPLAVKFLRLSYSKPILLSDVMSKLPTFDQNQLFSDALFIDNQIFDTTDGERLVLSTMPLEVNDKVEGIILFLNNANKIQEIEHKIRVNENKHGNFAKYKLSDIIGNSSSINECKRLAKRFGMFNGNVFIYGETGTGKELFAQAIHNASTRANGPFYAVNCAAIPVNILESELFGYSEGSFTGAKKTGKPGIFELAHGGTLFLDEIAEMDISCQSKLLRTIQESEVRRIGDDKIIPIDVRVITASNRNIYEEVEQNSFREDLLYRINVMNLVIPPLRQRTDDIKVLLNYFIDRYSNKYGIFSDFRFSESAVNYLKNYPWKGNIRELKSFAERIFVYGYTDDLITESIAKNLLSQIGSQMQLNLTNVEDNDTLSNSANKLSSVEKNLILEAVRKFNGNKTKAAEFLGVSRTYIWRHLKDENNCTPDKVPDPQTEAWIVSTSKNPSTKRL